MGIQEVNGKGSIPEFQNKKKSGQSEGFQESLLENLKSRGQGRCENPVSVQKRQGVEEEKAKEHRQEEASGVGMIGGRNGVRVNVVAMTEALYTAEVRHMSYEESDNVKIAVTKGFALKGKIMPPSNNDTNVSDEAAKQVYVEAKYEDGRIEAYRVDISKIPEHTQHDIERFALETAAGV